jgi:hypothetical protein
MHFEDMAAQDLSDNSNRKFHKPPTEYDDYVWHLGWTDGRYGQPRDNNEALLRAQAKLRWQREVAAMDAEVAAARARAGRLKDSLDRVRQGYEQLRDIYLAAVRERSENPQAFSMSLWLIYSLVALLLFAADLPLSLKLVAMGYGVTTEDPDSGRTVDNLLTDPRFVITHFWEAMLLALGIALAGVFVKYFIDSVVYGDERPARPRTFYAVVMVVLVGFLVTTVLLGVFRADQQRNKQVQSLTNQVKELEQQQQRRPSPQLADAINDTRTRIKGLEDESALSVRTVSFIALTLLFPVVGGICFSVGWRKLVKSYHHRKLGKEYRQVDEQYDRALLAHGEAEGAREALEQKLARAVQEYATGDAYAEARVSLYRHGYMRGRNVPETIDAGESLYNRCENSVAKLLAKKMRDTYWDGQNPVGP